VQVDLVGMAARLDPKLPKRPAYAVGSIDLPVPPKQRTLAVTVTPNAAKLAPGEAAKLGVLVKDAMGRPVPNAEAAVIVVDEAILALAGYKFPNPIDSFYGHREAGARDFYLRSYVKLAKPQGDLHAQPGRRRRRGGDAGPPGQRPGHLNEGRAKNLRSAAPCQKQERRRSWTAMTSRTSTANRRSASKSIAVRSSFNPPRSPPAVKTDASGMATVDIKLPDNLTRYRIVAIATDRRQAVRQGERDHRALPLMVRPSRAVLNFSDAFLRPSSCGTRPMRR
jgi:uncharacterized protein YfaS (alpha-2-macroglobulin family)